MIGCRAALVAALVLAGRPAGAQGAPLPSSVLSFRDSRGAWQQLWSSATAPVTWTSAPLATAMRWQAGASGLRWSETVLKGTGEAWRTRLIVADLDPARVRLHLDTAFMRERAPAWTLARAPKSAVLAVNAGQFAASMPWGWVVMGGRQWLSPQSGPLSAALAADSAGALHWIRGGDVTRAAAGTPPLWAFQSYPVVLQSDSVPFAIRTAGNGVDVAHRDARAGICLTRGGRMLVALTRFDGMGRALHFVPFGLTVPEMAGVMGALGCRDGMLLDGGISARLRIKARSGTTHDWEGLRSVPLALIALPRP